MFHQLLSVLAPVKTPITLEEKWEWERSPRPEDWERFRQVARRIVTLKNVLLCRLGPDLLEAIKTRDDNESSLVPNVQRVDVFFTIHNTSLTCYGSSQRNLSSDWESSSPSPRSRKVPAGSI
ncbi:hypothetical protein FRB98_001399 [Tulasnella sp. 332]|nr:hypothetical protein FRB98_001399 [Tulasnella sp. 332]